MSRWHTILAIDHDPKACEVYRANMPGVEVVCGSVADLFGSLPRADVAMGGPPCQPFSHAGKRDGKDDARDCVPDFIAAIGCANPRMFLMEQVPGFTTIEDGRYMHRAVAAMERAGYVVDMRLLDAVDFGVPQFRARVWFWGIRRDVWESGVRHRWPVPTHVWPWPGQACMFGGDLTPAVTVGQALGLDGNIGVPRNINERAGNRWHGTTEPSVTMDGVGGHSFMVQQSHADPARPVTEPASMLRSGGAGHDGCCVRVIGGGTNHPDRNADGSWQRDERDITGEPSTTIPAMAGAVVGGPLPRVHEYRWSDAMLEKHPPASPASPAPTVQAKWFKGGAEGLLAPSPTVSGGGTATGGAEPIRHGPLRVRRLTVAECQRLQSMPDDFVWPDSVAKTHRYRIVGNGWASLIAKRLGEAFAAADPESRTVLDLFAGGGCGAVGWHGRAWEFDRA